MRKADHTKIPLEVFVFALGLIIGITVSAMGESRLIPAVGISQGDADGLYARLAAANTFTKANTFEAPVRCPDGTKSLPGLAFSDGTNWDTGIYNVAAKGATIMTFTVDGADVMALNQDLTVFNDFWADKNVRLGSGASGNILVFRGMDSWTSQIGFTWNLDGATIFDASGQNVTGKGTTWDFAAGVTNFTVPDADAATEAMNRQASDARYTLSGSFKSGTVAGASFAGNPKIFTVTFNTAFPDTNYAIGIDGEDNRTLTFQTKLAGSFIINTNANLAIAGDVDWTATAHSDP